MSDLSCQLHSLHVYPVKSFAGIAPAEALLTETGLDLDRAWMVVDRHGDMLTQRELPRMALVQPQIKGNDVVLRAPGMLALHLSIDTVEAATRARVWDDVVKAFDMGDLAAQWVSDFLGRPLRLVRFDPDQRRLSNRRWTAEIDAENAFADAFPLLVAGTASLAELNRRLGAAGHGTVTMARFRPNLVLDGLAAFEEDHVDELSLEVEGAPGPVRLRLVKPCTRCTVPNVDPLDASTAPAVGDVLAGFRSDARVGGAVTFGMNAVVLEGFGQVLRVGQAVQATVKF